MRNVFNSALALCVTFVVSAQIPAIGQWRDHLPYSETVAVAEGPDRVYCASQGGLFALVKGDNSIERISKVNGLSDIAISTIALNPWNNHLLIAYRNGNLDVMTNKVVTNVPDIKNARLVGNKIINSVFFINQYAYLACGFGIVVFDTDKMEVSDTYLIGAGASFVNVMDITSDGNNLYAATTTSIYTAPLSCPILASFSCWTQIPSAPGPLGHVLPAGIFNQIVYFHGSIYAGYSRLLTAGSWNQDTLFRLNLATNLWSAFEKNINVRSVKTGNGYMLVLSDGNAEVYDSTAHVVNSVNAYSFGGSPYASEAIMAKNGSGMEVWLADKGYGLVHATNSYKANFYFPNGPRKTDVYAMAYSDGNISVTPGAHYDNWGNTYNNAGISTFINEQWTTLDFRSYPILGTDFDFLATAIDPANPNHIMYGSLGFGVFEFTNNVLGSIYNAHRANCSLTQRGLTDTLTDVTGLAYDPAGNLWVTNPMCKTLINCREPNGTWHAFDCSSAAPPLEVGSILVGTNGFKWAILPRGRGILVYDENKTLSNPNDDRLKRLNFTVGQGALAGTEVFSMVEDKNQQIWVGTDAGICVFYNPDNIFANSGFDAQQILIQQGVHVQILMQTQTVTALAIDGANRKWIGTASGGAFLMSADGTTQILNFNKDNSPIFSNAINAITVNKKTGEVFFGTDKGIISYRSTATEGGDTFDNVYAFPNPVRHEYEGPIAIKGLTTNAEVKITDITGNLIYQTTALGGQALWDGKNFKGERAHTGVYIVFCSDTDGKQTFVTKILFIN
jgi:hypothetical protein